MSVTPTTSGRTTDFLGTTFSEQEANSVSDKTQLTMAVMRAITAAQGIDMYKIVAEHVEALSCAVADGTVSSWPITTLVSVRSIALSNSITESTLREREFLQHHAVRLPASAHVTYFTSGDESSLSDGFLPKLVPVAMYYATRDVERYSRDRKLWELERLIAITHTHPLAYVTGIVYATFIERLLRMEAQEDIELSEVRRLILMELFSLSLEMEADFKETDALLSTELNWLLSQERLKMTDLEAKVQESAPRLCLTSLLWTLGLFLLKGVKSSIQRFTAGKGLISDARLSMVSSLVGWYLGRDELDSPYLHEMTHLEPMLELARRFASTLILQTATTPSDVTPAESLKFIETDDARLWAAPYKSNGPLVAEALYHNTLWGNLLSVVDRFWHLTRLGNVLEWMTRPTPLKVSVFLLGLNYVVYTSALALINHGKSISAPAPTLSGYEEHDQYEYSLHKRHFPVLLPATGGETRAYKESMLRSSFSSTL